MRMWMIKPELLCDKHLLGEHGEIHKHRHIFVKGYSIKNRVQCPAQIVPEHMEVRHNELAKEMTARGMKHASSYSQPDLCNYTLEEAMPEIDIIYNIKDLSERCGNCRQKTNAEK